jgi:hypothetical protein
MRAFFHGFVDEMLKTASAPVRLMQKRADAQADLTHYERRTKGLEPRRPTPAPAQGSMQGGPLRNFKPPPAPKPRTTVDMQNDAANLDGPDVSPPKPVAKPVAKPVPPPKPARVAGA